MMELKIYVVFLLLTICSIAFPGGCLPQSSSRRAVTKRSSSTTLATAQPQQVEPAVSRRRFGSPGDKPALMVLDVKKKRRPNPLLEIPNVNMGPKRNASYNPSWGYEPYWEGGDWVFEDIPPSANDMCGSRCNQIYIDYGAVCGRNKRFERQTFETYCAMRNYDCINMDGWRIAYRGECREVWTQPTHDGRIVTRVDMWLEAYSSRFPVFVPADKRKPRG